MILILYSRSGSKITSDAFERYLQLVPAETRLKIKRYRKWEDAQNALFSRLLLIEGLKRFKLDQYKLEDARFSEYHRPYFSDEIDFNISHSGEYSMCAISSSAKVGIDVEEVKEINVDEFTEQFSVAEINVMKEDKSFRHFYMLWTQKEAFLKAIGKGLHVPLNEVEINNNRLTWEEKNWFLHETKLPGNYCAHLCTDQENPEIETAEIKFY